MSPDRAELLAAVERSPQAAKIHDRAGWVGLFTEDGCIEDPYGSRPHVGRLQIERFYDTFIGPREITFHRDLDIVSGTSVVRDLALEVTMSSRMTLMTPIFIRYDLRLDGDAWRIARLRAYWELRGRIREALGHGAASVPVVLRLSGGLLRNQGLGGTVGFASGFRGVGTKGKRLVDDYLIERGYSAGKMLAAGNTVGASFTTSSGGRAILLAEIAPGATSIRQVEEFTEDDSAK